MFGTMNFEACIREQMETRGFGEDRANDIVKRFRGHRAYLESQGIVADGDMLAMQHVLQEVQEATREKNRLALSDAQKRAANLEVLKNANRNTNIVKAGVNEKADYGLLVRGFIEDNPLLKTVSFMTDKTLVLGQLMTMLGDDFAKIGKGFLGKQLGDAHMPNIIHELFGRDTGDVVAKNLATSWRKMTDTAVKLFNDAGGSMRNLEGWNFTQRMNSAKLLAKGATNDEARNFFVDFMKDRLDWTKTVHPDGTPIRLADRDKVMRDVFDTISTDGDIKIDPEKYGGNGRQMGNRLEEHRFLHYKDSDSWLQVQAQYADGNVYDGMLAYMEHMSKQIALVKRFGSNPELGFDYIANTARRMAAGEGAEMQQSTKQSLALTQRMFDNVMHKNTTDPNSKLGATVAGVSNVLTALQLGSAVFMAAPGDFATAMMVRQLNEQKLSPFKWLSDYIGSMKSGGWRDDLLKRSGFIQDNMLTSFHTTDRFGLMQTYAPSVTKRMSDLTMRLSGMTRHTDAARGATQLEFMGVMHEMANLSYEQTGFANIMQRYGITPEQWDLFRKIESHQPEPGVFFKRPIDAIQALGGKGQEIYQKFQGMIYQESLHAVPAATLEASMRLRDTTRPDTLAGTLVHSFAMYKNFPVTIMNMYGRLAMSRTDRGGRLAFIAGMGAALTAAGALGTQMKEIVKGNDPLPMNTPEFYGKAFLSGGAMGIFGDFLFSNVNEYGHTIGEQAAGPIVGLANDVRNLVFSEPFKYATAMDEGFDKEGLATRAISFASRYSPNLWYARLALQREVWDNLTVMADPQAHRKFNARLRKQVQEKNQGAWWGPGESGPSRLPSFTGGQ